MGNSLAIMFKKNYYSRPYESILSQCTGRLGSIPNLQAKSFGSIPRLMGSDSSFSNGLFCGIIKNKFKELNELVSIRPKICPASTSTNASNPFQITRSSQA